MTYTPDILAKAAFLPPDTREKETENSPLVLALTDYLVALEAPDFNLTDLMAATLVLNAHAAAGASCLEGEAHIRAHHLAMLGVFYHDQGCASATVRACFNDAASIIRATLAEEFAMQRAVRAVRAQGRIAAALNPSAKLTLIP